ALMPSSEATRATVTASRPSASAILAAASTTCAFDSPCRGTGSARLRDRPVHRRAGRLDDLAVAHGQPARVEGAQRLRRPESLRAVAGAEPDQREARVGARGDRDSAESDPGVAGDERAVTSVEEGHVAGGVARRGDHLERPDALSRADQARGLRFERYPGATRLAVHGLVRLERLVAGEEAGIAGSDQHLGVR